MQVRFNQNYRGELQLCNDVMGIALAVWSHAGYCEIFRSLDKALDLKNLAQLADIREAFGRLPLTAQAEIMSDLGHEQAMAAIEGLRENMTLLAKIGLARTA